MMIYNISEFVDNIVRLPWMERIQACHKLNARVVFFEDHRMTGIVSTTSLLALIRYSYISPSIAGFLARVLYYVNSDVLTDEVFQKLIHFPRRKLRRTFLVAIAHCPISVYQLQYICKLRICSESYAQLLYYAATNSCFTVVDVRRIVTENRQFFGCVDYLKLAENGNISEDKRLYFNEIALRRP